MGQLGSRKSAGLGLSLLLFFLAVRSFPAHHPADLTLPNPRKLDSQIQSPCVGTPFILLKLPSA